MHIAGLQKCSLIDFPGKLAATVFTNGCNFRCPFCHNAQLLRGSPSRNQFSTTDIFKFLEKRKDLLDGVVITGGEPTLQTDLLDFINTIKSMGFLVKLDTNGYRPHILKSVIQSGMVDYIAMDIKSGWRNYSDAAGININIEKIEQSIFLIKNSGVSHEFRSTLMRPFLSPRDVLDIAAYLSGTEQYRLQKFLMPENFPERDLTYLIPFTKRELNKLQEQVDRIITKRFVIAA
ncbi:MAG: anaerobic ribonucleoside-triphosphate reductase activating protein [Fibrobacteria bacterium]|nr:anaerobic ribonucleoside-triphosphate reductase activating protein [Fibrobacteria bacterium]